MNLNDIVGAVEDLKDYHGYSNNELVYALGKDGEASPIDGIDEGAYKTLCVIGSDGEPVVTYSEYERVRKKLEEAEMLLGMVANMKNEEGIATRVHEYLDGLRLV